ncbi:MAG: hypothetical protein ACK4TA_21045 [Saprospiraceae bacterium]
MKKWIISLIIIVLAASTSITTSSCSRKSGCPAYDTLKAPVNRKGELSTKGGKSGLFPKDFNKTTKKRKK